MTTNGSLNNKVLVIEDDPDILELMTGILADGPVEVDGCGDAETGLARMRDFRPGLVLLDVILPGMDGLEFCRRVKSDPSFGGVQVVMLTCKGQESDVAAGLAAGADDYLIKPFDADTLVSRVNEVLRRGPFREARPAVRIVRAGLVIDPSQQELQVNEKSEGLTATELRLLHFLASHPGRIFLREQLLARAIRDSAVVIGRNIDVHIGAIRRKLGPYRDMIETIRGVGYRFQEGGDQSAWPAERLSTDREQEASLGTVVLQHAQQ